MSDTENCILYHKNLAMKQAQISNTYMRMSDNQKLPNGVHYELIFQQFIALYKT